MSMFPSKMPPSWMTRFGFSRVMSPMTRPFGWISSLSLTWMVPVTLPLTDGADGHLRLDVAGRRRPASFSAIRP
jgi:hypothetical protein